MNMKYLLIVTVLVLILQDAQAYKAAVVEYNPYLEDTAENTILKNLEEYKSQYLTSAQAKKVDIIVFPEYGLTGVVEDPEEYAIDLNEANNKVITEITEAAHTHNVNIVINLLEKENKSSEIYYYNTNLVINRKGEIIAKYRKINLYAEPKLTPGNETVTFTTDFNVKFGIFTCFDILFYNPSETVLKNNEIANIIFPTAWYSTMPFYSALSVQHGYSVANGVNLLAANYGHPENSNGGSGIYLADGTIAEIYLDVTPSSKMIIQEVSPFSTQINPVCKSQARSIPASPRGLPIGGRFDANHTIDISKFKTKKHFEASRYAFKQIDMSSTESTKYEVCDGDFCCTFSIDITKDERNLNEIYKLMAFDGIVDFDHSKGHMRVCSLVACENDSNDSCGARINGTTKFLEISVETNVPTNDTTFYRPVTLNYNLHPIATPYIAYCTTQNSTNNSTYVKLATRISQSQLLVFGIYGRAIGGAGGAVHYALPGFFLLIFVSLSQHFIR